MEYQNTIQKEFRVTGPGLHTWRTVTVTVKPAFEDFGIAFRRTDRTNIITQPALANNVGATSRGTTLGSGRHSIATIEHLMSALHGMGVDNALIELDGGEVPIIDGSSRPWMLELARVGIRPVSAPRHSYTFKEPLDGVDIRRGALRPFRGALRDRFPQQRHWPSGGGHERHVGVSCRHCSLPHFRVSARD